MSSADTGCADLPCPRRRREWTIASSEPALRRAATGIQHILGRVLRIGCEPTAQVQVLRLREQHRTARQLRALVHISMLDRRHPFDKQLARHIAAGAAAGDKGGAAQRAQLRAPIAGGGGDIPPPLRGHPLLLLLLPAGVVLFVFLFTGGFCAVHDLLAATENNLRLVGALLML